MCVFLYLALRWLRTYLYLGLFMRIMHEEIIFRGVVLIIILIFQSKLYTIGNIIRKLLNLAYKRPL